MIALPSTYQELERVYQRLPNHQNSCIGVSAAQPGEGVSTLVDAIAKRAAGAGRSVLVVDFNLHHPRRFDCPLFDLGWDRGEVKGVVKDPSSLVDYLPAPLDKASLLKLKEPGYIEQQIEAWKQDYQLILIDTSAINQNNGGNVSAQRALAASDACILTVLAGVTARPAFQTAVNDLKLEDVRLLGVVMNDRFNPSLKAELLRESSRITILFPRFSQYLRRFLVNSQLLSIRV
ncbi:MULTISPECIES: hypothetical protein [unclassified Agarivorans]|uniref:hypothetical protein n=1 Tax=unclassified Agarivorans TaxID=2636026 RepID=UPI003D7DCCA3